MTLGVANVYLDRSPLVAITASLGEKRRGLTHRGCFPVKADNGHPSPRITTSVLLHVSHGTELLVE
jgi:hypothetical protein